MELVTTREATDHSHSIISQHFMEPEVSLPHSQKLSTCPYPEPHQSSPRHPIISTRSMLILSTHLDLAPPSIFSLWLSYQQHMHVPLPNSHHMPRPPHPPRRDNSNYTWRRVQITQPLVIRFSPPSRHFIPRRWYVNATISFLDALFSPSFT
jgi:hypothetical protein